VVDPRLHRAEAGADQHDVARDRGDRRLDLVRPGARGEVVLRPVAIDAEERVADAAPDQTALVARRGQRAGDPLHRRIGREQPRQARRDCGHGVHCRRSLAHETRRWRTGPGGTFRTGGGRRRMDLDSADTWRWIWLVAAAVFALGELAVPGSFFMISF